MSNASLKALDSHFEFGANWVDYLGTVDGRAIAEAERMTFHNDLHDWLGGYPYESARPDEVQERLVALGFEARSVFPLKRDLGTLGTGCAEYVLARVSTAAT